MLLMKNDGSETEEGTKVTKPFSETKVTK